MSRVSQLRHYARCCSECTQHNTMHTDTQHVSKNLGMMLSVVFLTALSIMALTKMILSMTVRKVALIDVLSVTSYTLY